MEPKKARLAITVTIALALAIIAVCLCVLFRFNPFEKEEAPEESPAVIEVQLPEADKPAEATPVPGPSDLKGCSEELHKPKTENYLPEYLAMLVYSEDGKPVSLQYRPEKKQYSRDVIMDLAHQTVVTAIAQENGYTLVLVQDGVAGWIPTQQLDIYQ